MRTALMFGTAMALLALAPSAALARDSKGRLPYHSWFVGFVPKNARHGSFNGTGAQIVVLALAYDSRTKGNVATEIVKYFYQLHFGIKKDYRLPDLLERGNFYQGN